MSPGCRSAIRARSLSPALWPDRGDVRAHDPASKGGSEATVKIEGGPGTHPGEPAARLPLVRGAGGGRAVFCGAGKRPPAPGHPAGAGGDAGRGAGPAAPGPSGPVHCRAGSDPQGGRAVAGVVRGWPVLGAAPAGRAGGVGPPSRRAGRDHPRRARRPAEAAATRSPRRAARGSTTRRYPPPPPGALGRKPKARTAAEAEFLAIGDGAGLWLAEAAAAGAGRVRARLAGAVQLARLTRQL